MVLDRWVVDCCGLCSFPARKQRAGKGARKISQISGWGGDFLASFLRGFIKYPERFCDCPKNRLSMIYNRSIGVSTMKSLGISCGNYSWWVYLMGVYEAACFFFPGILHWSIMGTCINQPFWKRRQRLLNTSHWSAFQDLFMTWRFDEMGYPQVHVIFGFSIINQPAIGDPPWRRNPPQVALPWGKNLRPSGAGCTSFFFQAFFIAPPWNHVLMV